jgi:polygalacturonase
MTRRLFGLLAVQAGAAVSASISFDVREFGARGDGIAKDTAAIQAAADAAARTGGTVSLPPGRYLSGTIHLKNSAAIHIGAGAVLTMSPDEADFDPRAPLPYPVYDDADTTDFHHALLAGENLHDVTIFGEGVIDGNRSKRGGPKPIALKLCQHVAIYGIRIQNAPNYAISLAGCDFVNIEGVTIENAFADGIDPDSCRHVRISNCDIDSRDDAIAVKSSWALGARRSSEDLTVANCSLRTNKNGFKFGSESAGDLRNLALTNCTMTPRATGSRPNSAILLESLDGANIQNVVISNISATGVIVPFMFRLGTRGRGTERPVPGSVRDISVSNLVATDCAGTASLAGIPGRPVERITLSGIDITVEGGPTEGGPTKLDPDKLEGEENNDKREQFTPLAAYGLYARHASELTIDGFRVHASLPDPRSAMIFDDLRNLDISGFHGDVGSPGRPVLWMNDVRAVTIRGWTLATAKQLRVTASPPGAVSQASRGR